VILAIAAPYSALRNRAAECRDCSTGLDQKWPVMAFGMPEANLSRQVVDENAAKNSQLDILVFGMPKTFQLIFL
jgi:hypothetical protein